MTRPKYSGGLGFRDIELFNLALLSRQAWRILTDPDSLSARVLRAKYHPGVDILNAEIGSAPSQIWRAIIEGRDVLKQGIIKRIGDGLTTHIWDQNWIPRPANMRPIASLTGNPPQWVSDLILPSAEWDRAAVSQIFLPTDAQAIMSIPLCTRHIEDFWSWVHEKNGAFTVRSAYRMLVETKMRREAWLEGRGHSSDTARDTKSWERLWKVDVPSKVKIFL